jgi:uncharacterized membrane protein
LPSRISKAFAVGEKRTRQEHSGERLVSDIARPALSLNNDLRTAIEIVLRHGTVGERLLSITLPQLCFVREGVKVVAPRISG